MNHQPTTVAISTLVTPRERTGVGNYLCGLIEALPQVAPDLRIVLLIGEDTELLDSWNRFEIVKLPFRHDPRWLMRPAYFLWQGIRFGAVARRMKIDVLHLPNLIPILTTPAPTVVTLFDLTEYHVPNKYGFTRQEFRKLFLQRAARRADHILTTSNLARREFIRRFGLHQTKITVTYLAPGPGKEIDSNPQLRCEVLDHYGIRPPFVLYVGKLLPHKNVARLIQAHQRMLAMVDRPIQLVLAGPLGAEQQRNGRWVKAIKQNPLCLHLGYVPDQKLAALLAQARVLVLPSLWEGFGLPLVEAMHHGTPVIAAQTGSMPEVVGNAGLLVNPYSVNELADAMTRMITDDWLHSQLSAFARHRSAIFSWRRCATETASVYRELARRCTT